MADKKKKTKAKSYLSVELFAMAFALLSALSFICLVTGDALFGDLGLVVRKFFLGVAGYMSFPLLIGGIYLGVKGVIGFKTKKSIKAVIIYALLYAFFIITILQTAMTQMASIEFSEYLSQCYQSGVGFASATPGGVLFALPAYPLHLVLSNIGVYILCALALVLLTVFLFRTPISNMFANSGKARAERKTAKAEKTAKPSKETPAAQATETAAADGAPSADVPIEPSRSAFGINGDFKLKSEKEKQDKEKEYSLKLLFGDGSAKTGGRSSYADSYDEDFAEKVDYIRRPYEMRGIKVESPMGDTARRVPYEPEDDGIDMNVSAPDSNVYVIRNEGGRGGGRIDAFDEASGRRGSDASETDDYNRDRFTRPERRADSYGRDERMGESYSSSYDSDTENDGDGGSDYGRSAPRGDYSERGGRDDYGRGDYGGRERSSVYEEREENDTPRGGMHSDAPRGYNDTDGEVERPSARSAATTERRSATSAYPFDYDEEEEGNTPNAAVLRKLNNMSRRTDDHRHSSDLSDKENLSSSQNESRSARSGDYGAVERGEERYRRNPVDYSGDTAHGETPIERPSYTRPTDGGVRRPFGESTGMSDEADGAYDAGDTARGESMSNAASAAKTAESTAASSAAAPRTGTQTAMQTDEEKDNPINNIPKSYKFAFPPLNLLKDYKPDPVVQAKITKEQNSRKETILQILNNPNIDASIYDIKVGPSLTRFEIQIPPRVPMRKVMEKYEDLNLWMEAKSRIRIIAPIPGTSRIGLEVPNSVLSPVGVKEIMASEEFRHAKPSSISFALGKDMVGKPLVADVAKMPHLLVAGATGTGKSVFLNTLLVSLIYKYSPEDLRIVLVDPKLVEFSVYRGIPELLFGEIFTEEKEASAMLDWMVGEMERRYLKFSEVMVRDIDEYNNYVAQAKSDKKMFRILIIIDEFADLMAVSDKKHMDVAIGRLAAKARSAGIHIILATQRPTTDIVDGSIKTNFPSRIVFKMSSPTDAMVVMGEAGAEKLLGDGDMFYKVGKMPSIERAQGSFISAEEVNNVCKFVRERNKNYYDECALEEIKRLGEESEAEIDTDPDDVSGAGSAEVAKPIRPTVVEDSYIKEAMRIAIQGKNVSISLLQRRLGVGYPKAGKIIDALEAKGYISSVGDNNKRRILMTAEQFEEIFGEPV